MKMKKNSILLAVLFILFAMLTSCCTRNYKSQPSVATFHHTPQISTSLVQISGDEGVLTIQLNEKGECLKVWRGKWDDPKKPPEEGPCNGYKLEETVFCMPPGKGHEANVDQIDGKGPFYCAPILFVTNGTDIRIKRDSKSQNRICKYTAGGWQCVPN